MNDETIEQLVNHLADNHPNGASCRTLSNEIGTPYLTALSILKELETLGCVNRTGKKRGTLWHLG